MSVPALMVQGTASHVGKSTLVAGLCRIFHRRGYRVAPFKAQNMSLNSAATPEGEIGRAQAVQAAACGLAPCVDMNPVLLKPTGPNACQWVVRGQPRGLHSSREHGRYPAEVIAAVRDSYARLSAGVDVMILEGAGSPAEINLYDRDFANMWMADAADAKVLLAGDIERGGVFAALYGTWSLAPQRERIRGFVINKFRGDASLLAPGLDQLRELTGVSTLGVIPFLDPQLPEEDSLGLPSARENGDADQLRVGVLRLPHIANFTDFEPLRQHPGVSLRFVWSVDEMAQCDVIILPGTKSTIADLQELRGTGLEAGLRAAVARGTPLLGICGGYQMLGARILDPEGVESAIPAIAGLDMLPVETRFAAAKRVDEARGQWAGANIEVAGYFIQHGQVVPHGGSALLRLDDRTTEGCALGRVWGVSLHGLFDLAEVRGHIVDQWRSWTNKPLPAATVPRPDTLDERLDRWADCLERHLDLEAVFACVGLSRGGSRG